jgi:hypothetical protein
VVIRCTRQWGSLEGRKNKYEKIIGEPKLLTMIGWFPMKKEVIFNCRILETNSGEVWSFNIL